MAHQWAKLGWKDSGVPVSTQFDDPYFSIHDGLAETRHVFLSGNDLPTRFTKDFHIAELGFGTGLNFLATLKLWRESMQGGRLNFTSFEAFPMHADDIARALQAFPELSDIAAEFLDSWRRNTSEVDLPDASLRIIQGDARHNLPLWQGQADAWYLDGFSPAKNPELWQPELLREVALHMKEGATLATYSAAGAVRRALSEAGLTVERRQGYGHKRHMVVAVKGART